ncbi:MAG: SUMF1/EgtB/PvdO family nonheme iron enzyme [Bacteroidales bacterium]|nr:SUMF1/EgtB/PvdO family nonheme iron enzyme [Bacteroidales bacterium]
MTADQSEPFLAAMRDSQLLNPQQVAELTQWVHYTHPDPNALALEVNNRGWMTAFQIREIYKGNGHSLRMGDYILLDLLGEGGMGRVFKARHTRLDRDVAVKVIRKEKLSRPNVLQRFQQEIRAAAHLTHPNVVLALDADECNGSPFYAMEFVEGQDLSRIVQEQGPMPFPLACEYIRQAALGLQHAFERGLVHRDVKPSNLLVTPKGQVKVLDLGLAMLKEVPGGQDGARVTQDGFVIGTPDYLAPEQAQTPSQVDIRADVYGLGASLFFLLTGRVPFEGETPTDKLLKHITEPPPSVLMYRPDVPPPLDALIRAMMAKRPEERPPTPAHVAYALTPFCPPPQSPPGSPPPVGGSYPIPMPGVVTAAVPAPSMVPPPEPQASTGMPVPPPYPPQPAEQPYPGQPYPGQSYPGQPPAVPPAQQYPAQPAYPEQPYPAQPYPGQPYPGQPYPGQPYPGQPYPGQPYPGQPYPAQPYPGFPSADAGFGAFAPHDGGFTAPSGAAANADKEKRPAYRGGRKKGWVLPLLLLFMVCAGGLAAGGLFFVFKDQLLEDTSALAPEITNAFGMKLILLPAGSFVMGSPDEETDREENEGPAATVTLSQPFYMSTTEITRNQFLRVTQSSHSRNKARNTTTTPEDSLSWDEAVDFCKLLNKKDADHRRGWEYRLPTEAEWEYACRAGSQKPFSFGDRFIQLKQVICKLMPDDPYADPDETRKDFERNSVLVPYPAGSTEANAFGLFDMHGNMWEWCQDYYAPYPDGPRTDPTGPATGDWRVLRGGAWNEESPRCRSAARRGVDPQVREKGIGFRVVFAPVR